jgi:hypothetical protein
MLRKREGGNTKDFRVIIFFFGVGVKGVPSSKNSLPNNWGCKDLYNIQISYLTKNFKQ